MWVYDCHFKDYPLITFSPLTKKPSAQSSESAERDPSDANVAQRPAQPLALTVHGKSMSSSLGMSWECTAYLRRALSADPVLVVPKLRQTAESPVCCSMFPSSNTNETS